MYKKWPTNSQGRCKVQGGGASSSAGRGQYIGDCSNGRKQRVEQLAYLSGGLVLCKIPKTSLSSQEQQSLL